METELLNHLKAQLLDKWEEIRMASYVNKPALRIQYSDLFEVYKKQKVFIQEVNSRAAQYKDEGIGSENIPQNISEKSRANNSEKKVS